MEATANRLLELRKSVHMSQVKLADALDIAQSTLNRVEHNQQIISDEVMLKYADYFDVSLDYICGRTDKPEGKGVHRAPEHRGGQRGNPAVYRNVF